MAGSAALPRRGLRIEPAMLVMLAGVLVLILYPVASVLGVVRLDAFGRLFTAQYLAPLLNTLMLTASTVVAATCIGVPLAWLCARSDLPGRRLLGTLVSMSFVLPVLLTAIAYVFLFGRNAGLVNGWFRAVSGSPLYNIYSFSGVVLISTLHSFPLVFFTTLSGLGRMNPELEEAGRICGMSPLGVFRRVTLGAVLPSIMAGAGFVVAETLTMLAAPLVLGVPAGIRFVTTELYASLATTPDVAVAVAISLPLTVTTVLVLWLQHAALSRAGGTFAMLSGKGAKAALVPLGRWRPLALALAWVPVLLSLAAPVLVLSAAAFMDRWWRGFVWRNFTFRNVAYLFSDDATSSSIVNTLVLSVTVAAVVALAGALFAIALAERGGMLAGLVRQVALLPLGIPHVVAAVLVTLAWYGTPFHLGGTLWLLAAGYVMMMLPYGLRTCEASRGQIDTSLAEAARSVGCSPLQGLRHVLLPLMKPGIFTSFVIVFLFVIKEFSFTSMVYSANTKTLAVQIYSFLEGGSYERTAAAALLLMLTAFLVLFAAEKLFRVSITNPGV